MLIIFLIFWKYNEFLILSYLGLPAIYLFVNFLNALDNILF